MNEELNEIIKKSKYKFEVFIYELNISRTTFYRIRKGLRELRENEMDKLSNLLEIPKDDIERMCKYGRNT